MTDNCDWERHKLNALQQIFQEVMFHEVLAMVGEQKEVPPPGGEHIEVQQFYRQLSSNESNHKEWSYDKVKVAIEKHSNTFNYTKLNTRIKNWKVPEREIHDCTDWIWRSRERRRAIELLRCKRICYAGGNSRCTVNESLNVQTLRNVSKVLKSSNAKMVNTILTKEREFDLVRQEQAFFLYSFTSILNKIFEHCPISSLLKMMRLDLMKSGFGKTFDSFALMFFDLMNLRGRKSMGPDYTPVRGLEWTFTLS